MDGTMVSHCTVHLQWRSSLSSGWRRASRAHANRINQILFAFFDRVDLHAHRTRGITIHANYPAAVLGQFLKHFKKKSPEVVMWDWVFSFKNSAVHTAIKKICCLSERFRCPYSLDLMLADFFLFRKVEKTLSGLRLSQESHKNCLRRGHQGHRRAGVRRCSQTVVGATRKVYSYLGQPSHESLRKNVFLSVKIVFFIEQFNFVFDLNTYIV